MRRRNLWFLVAALVVVGAGCDFPNIVPVGTAPLRYRYPVFTTVVKTADVTYGSAVHLSNQTVTRGVRAAVSLSGANLLSTVGAGDAPALLFHGTADPLVPYQWAVNTTNAAHAAGLDAFLETWQGAGHVPYVQFRSQILQQTS